MKPFRMTRARTDVRVIEADLLMAMHLIREAFKPADGTAEDEALAHVETFCAVALRVMKSTNPSKIRDAAMTEEIKARMDGRPCLD